MKAKLIRCIILVTLCTAILASVAYPASFVYSSQQKRIAAGVLSGCGYTLEGITATNPWTPYVFYIMNQRLDTKPAGWEFYNPLAPSSKVVGANIIKISKDMPEYWKVDVGSPLSDLMQLDVLFLPAQVALNFNSSTRPNDFREKLRKYVDGGGTLWIDNQGGTFDGAGPFFIPDLQFAASAGSPAKVPNRAHPLIRRPFALSWDEVMKIGAPTVSGSLSNTAGTGSPDDRYFASIITATGNEPIVSAAQYGSGHLVVSASRIGQAICEPVLTAGVLNKDLLMAVQSEDLKFAYNIINWGSEHTTFHKNARHSGHSFTEIGAPLVPLWEYDVTMLTPAQAASSTASSPAILDDMVFYVDGSGWLHAFDLTSTLDRDGANGSDDGITDSSQGAPYDEIWHANIGAASSPTTGYVPMNGGGAISAVFVTTQAGELLGFEANTGTSPSSGNPILTGKVFAGIDIPAPTYVDGTIYMGDGEGRLWAKNLFTGDTWQSPAEGAVFPAGYIASASPVVGSVRDSATGTVDHMVYQAREANTTASGDGISCFPIRVFNETLRRVSSSGSTAIYQVRSTGSKITDWHLYYVDASGGMTAVPAGQIAFTSPNFTITLTGLPPNPTIIADYSIDPVTPPGVISRGNIAVKTSSLIPEGVMGTPALSQKDILYFAATNGSLYAAQETGRGSTRTRVKWRWYLSDPVAMNLLGGEGTPYGSPAVAKDMVYFAVNQGANGYLLAFEADPTIMLKLDLAPGEVIDRSQPIRVKQIDYMSTGSTPQPEITVTGNVSDDSPDPGRNTSFVIDYDAGKITFINLRGNNNKEHDLSTSNDVVVEYRVPADPGDQSDPNAGIRTQVHPAFGSVNPNDKWNNLVWCVRFPVAVSSSPMVMGDILYIGLADGKLAAMDVEKMKEKAGGPIAPIAWNPLFTSDEQWEEQIVPSGDPNLSPIRAAVGGANGVLAVATSKGLSIYHNPITLCADGNRLVEFDASGRLTWSCDATTGYVASTIAGTSNSVIGAVKVPFNRPAVARRAPVSGIIVADTGNNRVVHIDTGGKVLWEITSFLDNGPVDATGVRGFPLLPSGSSLSLNRPMDVSMWMVQDKREDYTDYPEYHYLIADSGNYRVVEIVARYNGSAYQNELQWTTKTFLEGKYYRYTCARRVWEQDPPASGTWVSKTMCTISNYEADAEPDKLEGPGGVLVKIDDTTGAWMMRITQIGKDDITGADVVYKLQNPTFIDRTYTSLTEYADVVVDANTIYVVRYTNSGDFVRRYTPAEYYTHTMPLGKPLSVSYVQLLPNRNLLVSNKATGTLLNEASFFGEVFELKWNGAGYDYIPILGGGTNVYEPRQPSSAERLPY